MNTSYMGTMYARLTYLQTHTDRHRHTQTDRQTDRDRQT